eukprot:359971-Chlamydomonas_euryale.AAC.8
MRRAWAWAHARCSRAHGGMHGRGRMQLLQDTRHGHGHAQLPQGTPHGPGCLKRLYGAPHGPDRMQLPHGPRCLQRLHVAAPAGGAAQATYTAGAAVAVLRRPVHRRGGCAF